MSKYILAIDQGTTSSRAVLFDLAGNEKSIAQQELTLFYPDNGWVEQEAEELWDYTRNACRKVMEKTGAKLADIAGIGISNQRETTVIWDRKTGTPIARAIVWQDRRTASVCEELKAAGHENMVRQKTGLLIDPYFSATKIGWILDNVDGARARAEKGELAFGTVDCYLLWQMTGGQVHATDATNAARTMIFNIVTQDWDDELLALFNVPRALLPKVKDNAGLFGHTAPDFLGAPVAVTGMIGDQQASLCGQACFSPGMVKSTYGTGGFVLVNIGHDFRLAGDGVLTTVGYRLNGQVTYATEGAIFVAGAAVQWLRDGLGIIKSAHETEKLAQSVPDNAGVYLVPAFTGLGAPYWQPHARGAIVGLTRGATVAHLSRAVLEAQAYQTEDLMGAMAKDSGHRISTYRVDGGLVRNNWVCQFLADITNTPLERPKNIETTALGAAYMAGLGAGVYASLGDISKLWQCDRAFTPQMDAQMRNRLYAGWQHAIKQVLA